MLVYGVLKDLHDGGGLAALRPAQVMLAMMMGASASFATPIGYQTNLMVLQPGVCLPRRAAPAPDASSLHLPFPHLHRTPRPSPTCPASLPGGYSFADFARLGVPLTLSTALCAAASIYSLPASWLP